ncbi:MAG: hypothetical protein R2715_17795 [Ilumatobacteraceae bacterium]
MTEVVRLAKEAGVVLTPAGSTHPYGNDPEDRTIRIAPSFPSQADLEAAIAGLATCEARLRHPAPAGLITGAAVTGRSGPAGRVRRSRSRTGRNWRPPRRDPGILPGSRTRITRLCGRFTPPVRPTSLSVPPSGDPRPDAALRPAVGTVGQSTSGIRS